MLIMLQFSGLFTIVHSLTIYLWIIEETAKLNFTSQAVLVLFFFLKPRVWFQKPRTAPFICCFYTMFSLWFQKKNPKHYGGWVLGWTGYFPNLKFLYTSKYIHIQNNSVTFMNIDYSHNFQKEVQVIFLHLACSKMLCSWVHLLLFSFKTVLINALTLLFFTLDYF